MALEETEGMYFSGPDIRYGANTNQSTGKTADSFLAAYNDEWGEDPAAPFWAHSYDATTLLLDAIAAASYDDGGTLVIDRAGVREHLNSVTDYSGIIGLITCDAFGDCGSQKITVIGHADSGDVAASNANVVYEYAPGGSSLGEGNLVVPAPKPEPRVYDFSAASEIIEDYVDENGLNGASFIVVDRDDGVVHQEHFGELGPGRVAIIGPIGEIVSAGVVLSLHDDGLLDVDAPVVDIVAWGSGNPEVTLAQLLSHSSGMLGGPASQFYNPYLCSVMFVGSLQGCAETIFTTPDDDADLVPPDTAFGWPANGADYQVAGAVAEVASGKTWAELVDEIFVQPCGLNVLAYNNPWFQLPFDPETFGYPAVGGDPVSMLAPTENPSIMGGAYTTADDLAALLLMHLRDGMCGDERVLSTESLERMHEDRIARVYDGDSEFTDADGNPTGELWGYGMGFPIDRETGRPAAASPFGQQVWLDLDEGYAVLLLLESSWTDSLALYDLATEPVHEAVLTARG
jgi:CubicO group peptidase (beta-lactamase class C family)